MTTTSYIKSESKKKTIHHEIDFNKTAILHRNNNKLRNIKALYINLYRDELINNRNEGAEIETLC